MYAKTYYCAERDDWTLEYRTDTMPAPAFEHYPALKDATAAADRIMPRAERARALFRERYGERLDCDTVRAKPRDVDWSAAFAHEGDPRAELVYPTFGGAGLDECLAFLDEFGEAEAFQERLNELEERGGEEEEGILEDAQEQCEEVAQDRPDRWEPMMNYYYPLGKLDDPGAAQRVLDGLGPVVVVELDGEYVLALAGGGMDFSWEICQAHLALGFYPPLHFCELPRMSGRGDSDRDLAILAGCVESAEIAARWAQNTVKRLGEWLEVSRD